MVTLPISGSLLKTTFGNSDWGKKKKPQPEIWWGKAAICQTAFPPSLPRSVGGFLFSAEREIFCNERGKPLPRSSLLASWMEVHPRSPPPAQWGNLIPSLCAPEGRRNGSATEKEIFKRPAIPAAYAQGRIALHPRKSKFFCHMIFKKYACAYL